ncbi:MAG TPA: phosphopantothenoylcysteine decarboxylase [Oligoflexus sp.]|uniref:phosphopantothenoylcysteine decarboxylase domain-containing protein n=1 Tax=Oligoflexus sp. TaxID=1971216 RepID=UPI002D25DFC6|nr:phosphopantothenoylcysteine decarboxylase [Oligoflexus sp.]HYX39872.1 phosphopantothenoylcysteine decarboxylase [Oligoflexus sp.]
MASNDLHVSQISAALRARSVDLVVSGSIGAVESVRFIRSLRRLGAEVHPWLTQGGALFTTETALSWAAARSVRTRFEGEASHIAQNDACIIAPASASLISKVAQGLTDTPATALIASYLGQHKPVILVPNMHDSLLHSPMVAANLQKISSFCTVLAAREEEGKQKFPDPKQLADRVAHILNQSYGRKFLLTMGTTRGPIDDVRYISNYSSGALGSHITEEFYRYGHRVHVVAGPCPVRPTSYSTLTDIVTTDEMLHAVQEIAGGDIDGAIFAASVLDFVPAAKFSGKVRSRDELKVDFVRTPKIIAEVKQPLAFKVGFKLEVAANTQEREAIVQDYLQKYSLTHLVYNQLQDVNQTDHAALVFAGPTAPSQALKGKDSIAEYLVQEAGRTFREQFN